MTSLGNLMLRQWLSDRQMANQQAQARAQQDHERGLAYMTQTAQEAREGRDALERNMTAQFQEQQQIAEMHGKFASTLGMETPQFELGGLQERADLGAMSVEAARKKAEEDAKLKAWMEQVKLGAKFANDSELRKQQDEAAWKRELERGRVSRENAKTRAEATLGNARIHAAATRDAAKTKADAKSGDGSDDVFGLAPKVKSDIQTELLDIHEKRPRVRAILDNPNFDNVFGYWAQAKKGLYSTADKLKLLGEGPKRFIQDYDSIIGYVKQYHAKYVHEHAGANQTDRELRLVADVMASADSSPTEARAALERFYEFMEAREASLLEIAQNKGFKFNQSNPAMDVELDQKIMQKLRPRPQELNGVASTQQPAQLPPADPGMTMFMRDAKMKRMPINEVVASLRKSGATDAQIRAAIQAARAEGRR
jgi:hypothetical protein